MIKVDSIQPNNYYLWSWSRHNKQIIEILSTGKLGPIQAGRLGSIYFC